jgi:uncharacterized membrane protein
MEWGILARAIHVLAVVVWIGGVWLITTVLLPALRQRPPQDWLHEFEAIEQRFAPQVRIALLIVLLSGLYMIEEYGLWDRFARREFWWMDLMVGVWALYALMLFAVEPLALRPILHRRAIAAPAATLSLMLWFHRALLLLSLAAILAAVGGAHGLF